MATTVRKAAHVDTDAVTRTLSSAFSTDPIFSWALGRTDDPEGCERRLRPMFTSLSKFAVKKPDEKTEVHVTDDGHGTAIWYGIDQWKTSPIDVARLSPGIMRSFGRRTTVLLSLLNAVEKVHPTEPHYYLEFLGTRRDMQGKGVGSAVITEMLERCDREGVPAYLENSNPRNTPFYARHGFVPQDEIPLPKGAPPLLAMWREPKG